MNWKEKAAVIAFVMACASVEYVGWLQAQQIGPAPVRVYHVTNPAAFPPLPVPVNGLVFRNGLFQSPGIDYTASGAQVRFLPGIVGAGDIISITGVP